MAEQTKITTALAAPGESVEQVACPICGEEIALLPERMGMPLWVGDPTPAVCPACGGSVTLRLAYIEVITAQPSTVEHAVAEAAHLVETARALDTFAETSPELRRMLGDLGAGLRDQAMKPPPAFCEGGRVGFNCRPNEGGVDHHAHCAQGQAIEHGGGEYSINEEQIGDVARVIEANITRRGHGIS